MPTELHTLPPSASFANNRLFEGIPPTTLSEIGADIQLYEYEPDDVIFCEGDPGTSLFLVGEGAVKISKQGREGEQHTLSIIQAGSFFGEMALFDGQPRSAKATAVGKTVLGSVDEESFRQILEAAPSHLHLNFLRSVVGRLRGVNEHFISEVMRNERLSVVGSMSNSIIHDLKNPMCVIQCASDVLASKHPDADSVQLTRLINKSVESMLAMAQDLLDFSRGATSLEIEPILMGRWMTHLDEQVFSLLSRHNVRLVKEIRYEGLLHIDSGRFLRVIGNLVKNAIEAMPDGGILRFVVEKEGGEIVLRLEDTGVGITPELAAKVFEPFVTHGKSGGTGLGMSIARSVVEAHGGTISIRGGLHRGTTVEIRLRDVSGEPA